MGVDNKTVCYGTRCGDIKLIKLPGNWFLLSQFYSFSAIRCKSSWFIFLFYHHTLPFIVQATQLWKNLTGEIIAKKESEVSQLSKTSDKENVYLKLETS